MRTLALILISTGTLLAGTKHDFDRPVFIYAHHPDLPISEYAKGRLGIPAPEHARIYLYAAYRYLRDKPFTSREQAQYLRVLALRQSSENEPPNDRGQTAWQKMRETVPLPVKAPPTAADQTANIMRGYVYEDNCADDAFSSAALTLRARIRQFGLRSDPVAFWTKGQDLVFTACSQHSGALPDTAPASEPALIRADRDYQIAAALFYLQRFDEALAKFRIIAKDRNSPWRFWAPYLIGRTFIWQARATQDEKTYRETLRQAEAQFRLVLADPRLSLTHSAAERLFDRCLLVTDPRAGLERISARLLRPSASGSRESDLLMYLTRVDDFKQLTYDKAGKPITKPAPLPQDDFSLWWETFQSDSPQAYSVALERWHKLGSKAWLYCAISKAQQASPDAADLLAEALNISLDAPAGPALRYQAARLLAIRTDFENARVVLDQTLAALHGLPSAQNRALDLKFQLAPTLTDALHLAPRTVIMATTEMDADEFKPFSPDASYWKTISDLAYRARVRKESLQAARRAAMLARTPRLDTVGARVLGEKLPLDLLGRMALSTPSLPEPLQSELRLAVCTRAVLLGRFDVAREFAALVAGDHSVAATAMSSFANAPDGRPAEIAAARVLLLLPGARPYISQGYGRGVPAEALDEWARNWWYRFTPPEMYGIDLPYVADVGSFGRLHPVSPFLLAHLPFVGLAEEQQCAREWAQLHDGGERGLNWIAIRIADDVKSHLERPNNAETLYRVINSASASQWAEPPDYKLPRTGLKACYQLLTTRYSRTIWSQRARDLPATAP